MIKIGDFFENTEVLVNDYNSTCIIFKIRLNNIFPEDYFRRIIFLINDVVKNYKGNVSSNISLFEDGISTIECSFEGDFKAGDYVSVNIISQENGILKGEAI